MNIIINIATGAITVTPPTAAGTLTAKISVCKGAYDGLRFGFTLSQNGVEVCSRAYPPTGITYINTDQTALVNEPLGIDITGDCSVFVWCENAGQRIEASETIALPDHPVRTFCIVPVASVALAQDSGIRSLDGTQAVIFWEGDPPAGIEWPTFTLDEIRVEMQRPEWTDMETIE